MAAKRRKTDAESGAMRCEMDAICHPPWLQRVLDNDLSLTSLEVKHEDRISNATAKALAKALCFNTSLTRVDVTGDGITDETGVALAEAIQVNKTLERIFLDTDGITDATGIAMANGLRANVTLQSVTMFSRHPKTYFFHGQSNRDGFAIQETDSEDDASHHKGKRHGQRGQWMTDRTARAMAEAIRVNPTLERLELGVSSIRKDTTTAIARALRANTTMQHLFVNGRAISCAGPGPTPAQLNAHARRKANKMINDFVKKRAHTYGM